MTGAFQTSREIFDNPIWKNIVEFRLFFLIYGNAIFAPEGYRVSDGLILQRGQWLRSIRKLQEDLSYIENRQVKNYSTSVISRCIKKLEREQRICTKTHELGTVFTVVNYDAYQGFMNYKKSNLEHDLEQHQNSVGTVLEQSGNNNKNVNNVLNEIINNPITTTTTGGELNPFQFYEHERFGFLSSSIGDKIGAMIDEYGEIWVLKAMGEAVYYNQKYLPYVNKILVAWKKTGHAEPWTLEKPPERKQLPSNVKQFQRQGTSRKEVLKMVDPGPAKQYTEEERAERRRKAAALDGKKDAAP